MASECSLQIFNRSTAGAIKRSTDLKKKLLKMLVVIMKAVVQPNMEEHVARGSDIGETKLCQTLQHEVMDLFK